MCTRSQRSQRASKQANRQATEPAQMPCTVIVLIKFLTAKKAKNGMVHTNVVCVRALCQCLFQVGRWRANVADRVFFLHMHTLSHTPTLIRERFAVCVRSQSDSDPDSQILFIILIKYLLILCHEFRCWTVAFLWHFPSSVHSLQATLSYLLRY